MEAAYRDSVQTHLGGNDGRDESHLAQGADYRLFGSWAHSNCLDSIREEGTTLDRSRKASIAAGAPAQGAEVALPQLA